MKSRTNFDAPFSWVVCFACFLNVSIATGSSMNCGVYVRSMIEHYHSSRATGYVIAALSYSFLFSTGIVSSFLIDKTSHRTTALIGSVLACIGYIGSANLPSISWQCFTFTASAIGCGLTYQSSVVILVLYFKKYREIAVTTVISGTGVGTLVYPLLCIEVIHRYAWQPSLYIIAGLCLNMCVGSMFMFPIRDNLLLKPTEDALYAKEEKHHQDYYPKCNNESEIQQFDLTSPLEENDCQTPLHAEYSAPVVLATYSPKLRRIKQFYLLLLNFLLWSGSAIVPFAISADVYTEADFSVIEQRTFFILLGVSNAFGRFFSGVILNLRLVRTLRYYSICNWLWAIGVALYACHHTYTCLVISNLVFGLCHGLFISIYPLVTLEVVGFKNFNRAVGFVGLTTGVSGIAGPPLIGLIYDKTKNYALCFGIAASPVMVSAILSCFLKPIR